jgi:hypothetical protein
LILEPNDFNDKKLRMTDAQQSKKSEQQPFVERYAEENARATLSRSFSRKSATEMPTKVKVHKKDVTNFHRKWRLLVNPRRIVASIRVCTNPSEMLHF